MSGLGFLGLDDLQPAKESFNNALEEDAMHAGCKIHLQLAAQIENTASAASNRAV
jgi:hypothetical protein